MRFEVDDAALEAEARLVEELAVRLARLHPERTLDGLRTALVGSETARCADRTGEAWQARLRAVRAQLRSLGDGLGQAAAGYAAVESVAGAVVSRAGTDSP